MTSDIPPLLAGFTTRGRRVFFWNTEKPPAWSHVGVAVCTMTHSFCLWGLRSQASPPLLLPRWNSHRTLLTPQLGHSSLLSHYVRAGNLPPSHSVNKLIVSSWKKIRVRGNVSLLAHLFLLRGGHNPLSSTLQWPLCPAPCFHLVLTSALRLMDNLHSPFKLPEVKSSERTLNNRVLNLCWFLSQFAACKYSAWGQTLTFPTDCL